MGLNSKQEGSLTQINQMAVRMIKSDVEASVSFSMLGPWASDGGALDAGYIVQSFAPHNAPFRC